MKTMILSLLLVLVVLLSGCAAPATVPTRVAVTPTVPATATVSPASQGEIRVAFTTNADFGDLPTLLAFDELAAQGYKVTPIFFSSPDLAVAALTRGDADFGNGSIRAYWAAVAKDAPILTIMEQVGDDWTLVVKPELKTCADLNDKRIASSSASSVSKAITEAYILQNCPGTKPQWLYIADSSNRAAALIAGELDASPLELADKLKLERQTPGKFNTLANFAHDLPKLKTTSVYVQRDFAQKHPDAVRAYVRALLTLHRRIKDNPALVKSVAVEKLAMQADDADVITTAYVQINAWDVNGGMTLDEVQYTLDFFTRSGSLSQGLNAARVADLSYLNAVLDELGRK